MFISVNKLANELPKDKPDNLAANALQEGLGGQFGEMRTMMQYLFQNFNFRGKAKPYQDLIKSVASEEIGHVELISTTIGMLLDGSTSAEPPNNLPLEIALQAGNIHHFLVASQGAMPVDSAGNPWSGSYVYNSGNLVLDLLYNLMLECTGRLQKCRLYAMSDNKSFRATVSYLIVRDLAHEKVFAKALESLGVDWDETLPVPKTDSSKMPEVKKLEDRNLHNQQWTFSNEESGLSEIFTGSSPFGDGELEALDGLPEGFDIPQMPEAPQEYAPGLDKVLKDKAMSTI
ncbi:MAG: manganese catalase family protein [Nitrososphaeraceae archaeon]|nr:manganese catalase family protein [Nitrososphaeraceae archaeon]